MALIVEYVLRTPILRTAATAIPKIRLEEVYGTETGTPKLLFWAFGDEFAPFQSALTEDETVRSFSVLEESTEQRLYSVVLSDQAAKRLTYPVAAEHDITILDIVVTDDTVVRARAPSRDALFAFRDSCLERDVGMQLECIYSEREPTANAGRYGVTDRQQEALLAAFEGGYFDVPRETTLSALASELDISDQALSARLRRGQANLLQQTLAEDDP
ncbi:helix-turn-helix domain-containing protein [Halopiger djelfimassiliensis]|uniref:helix-turn-helix domain-containing protein n=1 Tax=Halopiger djelfimassiliensis TaxID=1293047 RepID=UPI0006775949|nr:helix-turn-helix domain-containing protein [Halopiger djelfimassiliensis]